MEYEFLSLTDIVSCLFWDLASPDADSRGESVAPGTPLELEMELAIKLPTLSTVVSAPPV